MLLIINNRIAIHLKLALFFAVSIFSCKRDSTNYFENLQGDWINSESQRTSTNTLIFSFVDSMCSYPTPSYPYIRYRLRADTLIVDNGTGESSDKPFTSTRSRNRQSLYLIDRINVDSLVLIVLSGHNHLFTAGFDHNMEKKIRLSRIKQQSINQPIRLQLVSTSCYGSCPEQFIQVTPDGEIIFQGSRYVDKRGWHKGKLSCEQHQLLWNKVAQVDWNNLAQRYAASATDHPSYSLRRINGKDATSIVMYGLAEAPESLQILIGHLTNLHQLYKLDSLHSPPQSALAAAYKIGSEHGMPPLAYNPIAPPHDIK